MLYNSIFINHSSAIIVKSGNVMNVNRAWNLWRTHSTGYMDYEGVWRLKIYKNSSWSDMHYHFDTFDVQNAY